MTLGTKVGLTPCLTVRLKKWMIGSRLMSTFPKPNDNSLPSNIDLHLFECSDSTWCVRIKAEGLEIVVSQALVRMFGLIQNSSGGVGFTAPAQALEFAG
jgi:hypothetical protein